MNKEQALEFVKCAEDIVYFAEKYYYVTDINGETSLIKLNHAQKHVLRTAQSNNRTIIKSHRQFGKSTISIILSIHKSIFEEGVNTVVVLMNMNCIRKHHYHLSINLLPSWMYSSINLGETSIIFGNKSCINFITPHNRFSDFKAENIHQLIVDEMNYMDANKIQLLWDNLIPIVTLSKDYRIFVASSKAITKNLFDVLYNTGAPWYFRNIPWSIYNNDEFGYRNEAWATNVKSVLGLDSFILEYENTIPSNTDVKFKTTTDNENLYRRVTIVIDQNADNDNVLERTIELKVKMSDEMSNDMVKIFNTDTTKKYKIRFQKNWDL